MIKKPSKPSGPPDVFDAVELGRELLRCIGEIHAISNRLLAILPNQEIIDAANALDIVFQRSAEAMKPHLSNLMQATNGVVKLGIYSELSACQVALRIGLQTRSWLAIAANSAGKHYPYDQFVLADWAHLVSIVKNVPTYSVAELNELRAKMEREVIEANRGRNLTLSSSGGGLPREEDRNARVAELPHAERAALVQYESAEFHAERRLKDREAYEIVRQEAEGDALPPLKAWLRNLGRARKSLGEQKNKRRHGRAISGKSVISVHNR